MYLSFLLIDLGDNPDRPRPGRLWMRNFYHVHQRLCMGFPSDPRKETDPKFLAPYRPEDFLEQRHLADRKKAEVDHDTLKQVHAQRNGVAGFLFRVDPLPRGRAAILVQSALRPDWEYAFRNAGHFLAAPPEVKSHRFLFEPGQRFSFRLLANPTRKIATFPKKRWDAMTQEEREKAKSRHGKRVPVPSGREIDEWRATHPGEDPRLFVHEKLAEWLTNWRPMRDGRPEESAGFSVDQDSIVVQPGYVYFNKGGKGQGERLRSARFDGTLMVENAARFRETLMQGIGSGKAFGFGLLSIAPIRNES